MQTYQQLFEIIELEKNVIFCKDSCPFCTAAIKLLDKLVDSKILESYRALWLDKDFDNSTLKQIVLQFGWLPQGYQEFPTKPQIFVAGKYIGDNMTFYKSEWNKAQNMPNLVNPMYF